MNNLILLVAVVVCLTNTGWSQSETAESSFLDHKTISLQQAIADRDGAVTEFLLDPVYIGKFKLEYESRERENTIPAVGRLAYTFGSTVDRGMGRGAMEPRLALYAKTLESETGRAVDLDGNRLTAIMVHVVRLPDLNELQRLKTLDDFVRLLGPVRSMTDGWSDTRGGLHSHRDWRVFTLGEDGQLSAMAIWISVTRHPSDVVTLDYVRICSGTFAPTARSTIHN